jgi:hypothetical protein
MKNAYAPAGWSTSDLMSHWLILKRASASRPSGQWRDDDFDVPEVGVVIGRIYCRAGVPEQAQDQL